MNREEVNQEDRNNRTTERQNDRNGLYSAVLDCTGLHWAVLDPDGPGSQGGSSGQGGQGGQDH